MIEQIKKAEQNGLDLKHHFRLKYADILDYGILGFNPQLVVRYKALGKKSTRGMDLYRFIFGTDFLDSLVGKGRLSKICCNCSHGKPYEPSFNLIKCEFHSLQSPDNDCGNFDQIIKSANYHREQLANMTLDEMIEYISKL